MPELQPNLVAFDLGGVLIDWNPRYLYRKLFDDPAEMERFLSEVCHNAWNLEQDRGRSFADAIEEASSRHPGQRLHIEAFFSRWIEMVGGPIGGTVAILEELAADGRDLVALSNWSHETFPLVRDDPSYGFLRHFETIFLSAELGLVKPDAAIYRHVLEATGRAPGQCFFIDDNEANVAAARALGIVAHRFTDPASLRDDLRRHRLLG